MTQIAQQSPQTVSKKHDRTGAVQNTALRQLKPTGERPDWLGPKLVLSPTKADLRWLDGLTNPAVFDQLDQPWWKLALPVLKQTLATWKARSDARDALAKVDAATLRDAGISPGAAAFEASQPFWQAPVQLRDYPEAK